MSQCKGICDTFPQTKVTKHYYVGGNVFCRSCDIHYYKFFDGRYCPCCKSPVRTKPRKQKGKNRVLGIMLKMTALQIQTKPLNVRPISVIQSRSFVES